jgi:protein-S-isoprenylcysteine O-methyltransferase Ste14
MKQNSRLERDRDSKPANRPDKAKLEKIAAVRLALFLVVLGLMLFCSAGTFHYWQAWTYIAILFLPMLGFVVYYIKKDPELLERRMRTKEKEQKQKWIIRLSIPALIAAFLLPGFDRRYGWSAVPPFLVVIADIIILAGYGLFVLVMRENRCASRVIEVEENQKVVTTGPYAVIRHPMYLAGLIIYLFSPLALGSFWAVLAALPLVFIYVARIRNEETVLAEGLEGYREYLQRVRYRLIPGVW